MSAGSDAPARPRGRAGLAALLALPQARAALELLGAGGEGARLVGGAVRDALIGAPVHDLDVATTRRPEAILEAAKQAGLRALPTGIDHGTVTLLIDGAAVEATTLRADVATDGRHAQVVFGDDFDADAARRDFTINAMSLDLAGRLSDPFGGAADLAAGRVRFIGEAAGRIREDYLRILRFFRFTARFAERPDPEGFAAVVLLRAGLARLSAERVREELLKILAGPRAGRTTAWMLEAGLFAPLFGAQAYPARLARAESLGIDDLLLRLAALTLQAREDVDMLRLRLRLSNAQTRRLTEAADALAALRDSPAPPHGARLGALVLTHGAPALRDAWALRALDPVAPALWIDARENLDAYADLRLPAAGADLVRRGLQPGPAIGRALKDFQARWIRAKFPVDPAEVARLIDESVVHTRARRYDEPG